jgi:NhaP-type Na+/H+ or K+/H+ antiporter
MYQDIVILALFIFFYSTVAGAIERTWISGAIIFTAFGLLIGPVGLDLISFKADGETIRTLAELTLALVLFTDAAGADLVVLRKTEALPTRLLLIGLPMTIVLGFGVAVLLFPKTVPVRSGLAGNHAGADRRRAGQSRGHQ